MACQKANTNQMYLDTEETHKTVLEMEMNANYSSSDPFEDGRLFYVSEDIETLWSNTWDKNIGGDTVTASLNNLQKEKEYVVRFTGTRINHADVKVTFESELVQEKSRPSK